MPLPTSALQFALCPGALRPTHHIFALSAGPGYPSSRCTCAAAGWLVRAVAPKFWLAVAAGRAPLPPRIMIGPLTCGVACGSQCINLQLHKFLYNIPAMMI